MMRLEWCSLGIILAFVFGKGLDWRGIWIALPFFYATVIWSIVWVTVVAVKPSPTGE
jgi:hypothetical protein